MDELSSTGRAGVRGVAEIPELLSWAARLLERSGVPKPRLNAERLLSHCTGRTRVELYAYPERPPGREERREFMRLEPGRADVIVGGCGVLVTVMRETGLRELLVSEKDILDGMVLEAAKAIG